MTSTKTSGGSRRALMAQGARLGSLLLGGLWFANKARAAEPAPRPAGGGLAPAPSYLHVGINVADMERSTRFYVEALGFEKVSDIKPDGKAARIMGFAEVNIKARTLRLAGGLNLLMREFVSPKFSSVMNVPAMNQPSLMNFAIRVDDIDRVGKLVNALGGKVVESTRTLEGTPEKPGPDVVFCFDPDGIRIELVKIG